MDQERIGNKMMNNSLSRISASNSDSKTLKSIAVRDHEQDDEQHKIPHMPHPPSIPNYKSRHGRTTVHPLLQSQSSSSDSEQDGDKNKDRTVTTKIRKKQDHKTHKSPIYSRIRNTRIVPSSPIAIGSNQPLIQSPKRRGSLHSLDSNSSWNTNWSVYQGSTQTSTPQQADKIHSKLQTTGKLSKLRLPMDQHGQQSLTKSETDLRPTALPPIQSIQLKGDHDGRDNPNGSLQAYRNRVGSFDYNLNRQYHSDQNLKKLGDGRVKLSSMSLDDHNLNKSTKFNQSTVMLPIYTDHIRNGTYENHHKEMELDRYFPDRQVSLFVGTWNMHGEKDLLDILCKKDFSLFHNLDQA
ncbi:uncharacterized protein TRIADDRAFT_53206 [Trichoplax adhaerens]|uniref:Inositol polyphosphate-related phosphatase domain-containing protein n=1 Tax=Trichoplax adhaerens TaxID=10228 RepID=B3RNL3_TRIAD|nr:predicted protein [Trichoplax adhaerens]EDV27476.1 predicted protein [Trichoplax adhaerens]|eukprot:XP_002109310.1 predicted protein [Trichoplax adhaerens]